MSRGKAFAFKKKTILGTCILLVGFVVAILSVAVDFRQSTEEYAYVAVKNDLKQGAQISKNDIEALKTKDINISKSSFESTDEVMQKYINCAISKGDILTKNKLSDTPLSINYETLKTNQIAVAVTFQTQSASLSNNIKKDDIISVFAVSKDSGADPTQKSIEDADVPAELKYVRVLAVNDEKGLDMADTNKNNDNTLERKATTVTLLCNEKQAKVLVGLEKTSYLHFGLVSRGDNEQANAYLTVQDNYLKGRVDETQDVADPEQGVTQ